MNSKAVLVVGAHPDDVEFGCAGFLMKMKLLDYKIIFLLMTNGGKIEYKNKGIRVQEQKKVCEYMQYDKEYFLGIEDTKIKLDSNVIEKIENIILENNITTILSNYPDDSHQDHRELSNIIKTVGRLCNNVLYYETLSSHKFNPNLYVNIDNEFNSKINALKLFGSQIEKYKYRGQDMLEVVELKNRVYGQLSKCKFAEGFYVEKVVYNGLKL